MKNLIFEALVTEAQFRVAEHTITGIALDEAIDEVSREMELEGDEVHELTQRVKKSASPRPVVEDDEDFDVEEVTDEKHDQPDSESNAIYFTNGDELETAQGVLMYKGIPWITKGESHLAFQDPQVVADAHEALKRRWDFVNKDERTVAVIEFDNIEDYKKVLDFIASKNMTALPGTNEELADDLDQELAEAEATHKRSKKDAKDQGLPSPEMPAQNLSYQALHKDKLTDLKGLDPDYDRAARCVRVVKRWK